MSATEPEGGKPSAGAMTVRGAAFLGVGSMVGAGIFALLGQAGAVAGSAVWLSFLIAGVVAALQGYAVAKLGARYPSSGGIVTFLLHGFGRGHITAVTSWLLYFAALIVTAMVSVSFGSYGSALFFADSEGWATVLTAVVIVAVAAVNIAGASSIDRVQSIIVVILLAVFAVFIGVTLAQVDPELLAPSTYPRGGAILSSVALTFFAYLIGFITPVANFVENYIDVILILAVLVTVIPALIHYVIGVRKARRLAKAEASDDMLARSNSEGAKDAAERLAAEPDVFGGPKHSAE